MTWTQELDWYDHHLTLTRGEGNPIPDTNSPHPPAPGAGDIRFPALYLYCNGDALHLEAEISGDKVARVYLDVHLETGDGWMAGPVCRCEIAAPHSKEIGGVHIPVWPRNAKASAIWRPAVPLLVCGHHAAWGFAQPAPSNPMAAWVNAAWISENQERPVRLQFDANGILQRMTAPDSGSRGLFPRPGDQLIPAVNWLRQKDNVWQTASGSSNAIPVTDDCPRLESVPALPGSYRIGLLALDLDGQPHRRSLSFEIPAAGLIRG